MSSLDKTVAFIGLGVMGYPMALNLRSALDDSYKLLICDVSEAALSKFQSEASGKGPVEVIKSGHEAINSANTVITMLPTARAVESVYLDEKTGIIPGAIATASESNPRQILIMECGTIETSTILKVAEAAKEAAPKLPKGTVVDFVDAPVSGGPMGAQAGTLTFMVGATATGPYEHAKKYLQHMGKKDSIFHCGDVGAGTAFKVINNYLSAITSLAASEALNIGAKMGLDLKLLTDVINVSGGQCWVTSQSNPVPGIHANAPASRDYEGGFRIELCNHVLEMGSSLAEMVGAKTVLDKPTLGAFKDAMNDERYKGKDARVVYKWLNDQGR
ncbi:3-hydroxyisobutyrate dehydrogenase [Exophiala viscosa]|uniref:3-hydroxyisobutyrate dehydrogenase n=1 Tax=Exophiala viscosa TaxID=2486360 RepID=A0AAN6DYV5_9EURO|nr:3-hydroxyisobutyrate dehydrogenase [Exophiala viscosa]KAI1624330.1 3-hydroxyisobutyrate dehydrogenase [Exophiala viscosa]